MATEIWKNIKGYEGLYQISNLGKIKSLKRIDTNNHFVKEKIIKTFKSNNGYEIVSLSKKSKNKTFLVHRLVAIAFLNNFNKNLEVNHIDGNKFNNNVLNLECVTHSKNILHNYYNLKIGKKTKKVIQYDKNNKFIQEYISLGTAAKTNNICCADITKCCKGKRKTAGGYVWKYKEVDI